MDRLIDLDVAAAEIERRRATWAASGFTVGPVTWRDGEDPWPQPFKTDRTEVADPDSIGVILELGDLLAFASITLYRGGLADVDLLPPGPDQAVFAECPSIPDVDTFGAVLDSVFRRIGTAGESNLGRRHFRTIGVFDGEPDLGGRSKEIARHDLGGETTTTP